MRTALVALTISLTACSASNVNLRGPSSSAYAPANDSGVTGEISYCNGGAKSVRDARRNDAYEKMYKQCGGAYEIVKEEDQPPAFCAAERRIWFKCKTDGKPAQ